jgi:lipopolysaccharide export system protein LptC
VSCLTVMSQSASHADVSQVDDRGPRAFASRGRTDNARVFRAARRHSRFVRLLRVAIPTAVVFGAVTVVLSVYVFDPLRALSRLPGSIGGLVVSGTTITMQQPRLAGYTQDRRPYVVTATAAAQDITKPDTVQLQDLRATIEFKDSGQFELTADSGLFESKEDRLTLKNNVRVNSANYQAKLIEVVINVRTNEMVSEKPVEVTMRQGTINANRLEVTKSGEAIRFGGGVTMVLVPENDRPGSQAANR